MKGRVLPIVAIVAVIVLSPAIVWAATGSFTSSTSTPAVQGTNSNSGGKGVAGFATSSSSTQHIAVYGRGDGSGGVGAWGTGAKYGVYSNGPLGIATGKSLVCTGCVGASDLAASAQPSIVTKDGSASVNGSVGNTCTNLDSITISAPASGKVTVDVDVHVNINHTTGSDDWFQMMLASTNSDCATGQSLVADQYVNSAEPTSTDYRETLHLMETFTATTGSHTYYINVKWPFGGDSSDSASRANLRAMFVPD